MAFTKKRLQSLVNLKKLYPGDVGKGFQKSRYDNWRIRVYTVLLQSQIFSQSLVDQAA